jgi:hypothetical protein
MKESYLVGYDPQMKVWEVGHVFTEHPEDYWVFKTAARDPQTALKQAAAQFQDMCRPSAARIGLYQHICKKTTGLVSHGKSMLVLDIPAHLKPAMDGLVKHQLLIQGEGSQVYIPTQGPLWKYLDSHFKHELYAPRREAILEI